MPTDDPGFKATVNDGFIRLETWGKLHQENLDAPANAAIALGQKEHIDKLLDNIQNVDAGPVPISIQAKGLSILWKLRAFQKVAIVFKTKEMGWLFLSSLQAMHLNMSSRFKGFDNETEATVWLKEQE